MSITTLKFNIHMLAASILLSASVNAATPTQDQINQFQSLPKAQQEQLARQMGVDLSAINSLGAASSSADTEIPEMKKSERATEVSGKDTEAVNEQKASELPYFGYDVFSGGSLDFTPVDNLPVPHDYIIAPGDEVRVQLYGKSYSDLKLKIDREGKLNIPEYGPEYVAGQTFSELKSYVASLIQRKSIGVEAVVSLSAMRTMQVFVTGDVKQPGAYNVNGLTTLSQALIAAGGIKFTGSLRDIKVKRLGKTVVSFDAYDLIVNGNSSQDIRLQAGDTILVPAKQAEIVVKGEVLRPAHYEIKLDSRLNGLINIAGGALPSAYLSKVSVKRRSVKGIEPLTLDLSSPHGENFKLQAGDEVSLLPVGDKLDNAIALRGELFRQGAYQFVEGLRISDVISRVDLKENADLSYALLVREKPDSRDISVWQFNLGKVLKSPSSVDNFSLHKGDQLFVFDNGLNVDYWYREQKSTSSKRAKKLSESIDRNTVEQYQDKTLQNEQLPSVDSKSVVVLDSETGALVEKEQQKKLDIADDDKFALADDFRLSSRESLLKPIIERLKGQANITEQAKIIEVTGAVKYPGVYPLAENANFEKLIASAGGFAEQAFMYSAELSRSEKVKQDFVVQHYSFSPNEILSGQEKLDIQAQDHIVIKTQPNWQRGNSIELQGEVVFPGTYTFQRGETIQDLIERAGGLTQFAYAQGAVFSRESLRRQEEERLKLLNLQLKQEIGNLALRRQNSSATFTTSPTEAMTIADELASTEAIGRLVINLPEALAGNSDADIMVEKGDKLYVPARQPIVSVMGEVQFSSNHTFTPGMTIEDYISSAGGTKKQADTDRVYVVRADGSVMLPNNSFWFSRKSNPLEPGDTIIVPLDTDYLDGLSTLTSATQILYQIGVAWSAVKD
ncbi:MULTISPECIES: SLBB domain-containing protein [Vibrio]|nr:MULTISPECIES: SLBB domain-containing protein [unclassified Vibrio]MDE3899650.1 SLBB domain-containing protein [Vibrio sp. CC007]MCM5509524.1 SLBB domain-containing protein [Vibrio sp. SCSIO 43169]QFT35024.1 Polysialic acid transport protein KpsD precursor [Vibrio sp. THAF64]QGM32923.1 Polysialic acid transport protein KpsD precursor [Vibrio sp. THAF191d]QGN68425.1 Polysialic acid transport protein KpsD precursor [Vibrio sp. THAF191c]